MIPKALRRTKLTVERSISTLQGTIGTLFIDGAPFCFTLELPWKNNKSNVSCIPDGKYSAKLATASKFKSPRYLLENVVGRSGIFIHAGNWGGSVSDGYKSDIEGCILVGSYFSIYPEEQVMLRDSGIALEALHKAIISKDIDIEILWKKYL